tara:strand:+ start:2437 stop:2838 length:402 start_codon:yes stop_codon:yes gene_type:complete
MKQQPLSQQSINVAKEILDQIIEVTQDFHDDETIDGVTYGNWDLQLNEETQARKKLETNPALFLLEEEWTVSKIISDAEATKEDLLEWIADEDLSGTDPDENPFDLAHNIRRVEKDKDKLVEINRFLREIRKE